MENLTQNNQVIVELSPCVKDSEDDLTIEKPITETASTKRSCLPTISLNIVRYVEMMCGQWGYMVASYPYVALVSICVFISILACGLVNLNLVFKPYDLWVPRNSEFYEVTQWIDIHFPHTHRKQIAIWEAENIFTASIIKDMWELHKNATNMEVKVGGRIVTWSEVCTQLPSDYTEEIKNLSLAQDTTDYVCYESSLLELWEYDEDTIVDLTDDQVLYRVNNINQSLHYGGPFNLDQYVGSLAFNDQGRVVGAKTTLQTWVTRIDSEAIAKGDFEIDIGTGEKVDSSGIAWERSLVNLIESLDKTGFTINLHAGHTLGHVLYYSIAKDSFWIGVGWVALLIYVLCTLGNPFQTNRRIVPAVMGLFGIGLSILGSYGACAMFGVPYGTLTNVLPVLLVAIGVDDMYVIATAWDSIDSRKVGGLLNKARLTMKRAGMAITVTSLTDILAFSVGTATTLPGLRYFCIYSSTGIAMVYFVQATLFVAVLVLNERKIEANMSIESFVIDFKNSKEKPSLCSTQLVLKLYTKFLMIPLVKGFVLAVTCFLFLFSGFNLRNISREFDTFWLVPESSNLHKWYDTIDETFPHESEKGIIFFKDVDLPGDLDELNRLTSELINLPEIIQVEAWFEKADMDQILEEYPWVKKISKMEQCKTLIKNIGLPFRDHFRIDYENYDYIYEHNTTHPCSTFKIEYQYIPPSKFQDKQDVMDSIRMIVNNTNITGYKAAWAHRFSQWETDRIIIKELLQSVCIVLVAVGVITIILLASLRTAFFVLLCVIGTLLNVLSFVHLWDLSVNTVTGIAFVLAIGICVDYAAHIAHDFLVTHGTRNERVTSAIRHMGLAVIHGGCSTFITFLLLAPSDSYIFVSYFKILSSVSIFGMYHALVFLPVMLSLFGPAPYPSAVTQSDNDGQDFDNLRSNTQSVFHLSVPFMQTSSNTCSSSESIKPQVRRPTHRKSKSLPSYSFFVSTTPYQTSIVINQPVSKANSYKSLYVPLHDKKEL